MKISKIEKEYLKKIKLFQEYNKYYYDKNNPKITDSEFDLLKKEIIELEKKHKFLNSEISPSKTIGFTPSKNFKKVKHKIQMLSLSNAFNEEDLENFEKKIRNFLSLKENAEIEDRTIDSHVKRIRKKFKKIDEKFSAIETRYGSGYRWNVS